MDDEAVRLPGRSESVAAVVNGLLVVLLPLAAQVVGSRFDLDSSDASVTANIPGSPRLETMIPILMRTRPW